MQSKKVKKKMAKIEDQQELIDISSIPGLKVIPIRTRDFVQLDLDFTAPNSIVELPVIKPEMVRDAIVKVNIRVKQEDAHKINASDLEQYLKQYAYVVKPIIPVIQRQRKVRVRELTTNLGPLEAIKIWLMNRQVKNIDEIFKIAEEIVRETDEAQKG